MHIEQRTGRRADKPGAPPKAVEKAGNHVFRRSDLHACDVPGRELARAMLKRFLPKVVLRRFSADANKEAFRKEQAWKKRKSLW
jgi:hypothetical protein